MPKSLFCIRYREIRKRGERKCQDVVMVVLEDMGSVVFRLLLCCLFY